MAKDMTKGSPWRLLLGFSIPLLIGNIFQQLYNLADAVIVGKTLGADALAAVGATGSVMFLVFGFYFGLTGGLTVVTGQRFGAGDPEGVRKSVAASTIICAILSLVSTFACVAATPLILRLMNTPDAIYAESHTYMSAMFWGTATIVFYGQVSSILRALGDSMTPLVFLIVSCLLNIGLDLLFIRAFGWGVGGAAWATVIAQALSALLCLAYMLWRYPMLRLRTCNWNVCPAFYLEHLRVAMPMALQFSITAVGIVVLQAALNRFGATYIAAVTAANKIDSIAIQPMFSFSMAMAAYAAQNYGARDVGRIRRGTWSCAIMSLAFAVPMGVVLILFAKPLVRLFLDDPSEEILQAAQTFMNINCGFYVVLDLLLIYRNVLQGMGYTFYPLMAGVAELILRVVAAIFLAQSWGYPGVCFAHPLAWFGATAVLLADYLVVMRHLRRHGIPDKDGLVRRTEALAD